MYLIHEIEYFMAVQEILPEVSATEYFFVQLVARGKYLSEEQKGLIKSTVPLKQAFVKDFDGLYDQLKEWEKLPPFFEKGVEVPKDTIVALLSPNPVCKKLAAEEMAFELWKFRVSNQTDINVSRRWKSQFATATSQVVYMDFDVDLAERPLYEVYEQIFSIVPENICHIIETRGGFHTLVKKREIPKEIKNNWYLKIKEVPEVTLFSGRKNKVNIPIPGTLQGGFIPKLKK